MWPDVFSIHWYVERSAKGLPFNRVFVVLLIMLLVIAHCPALAVPDLQNAGVPNPTSDLPGLLFALV